MNPLARIALVAAFALVVSATANAGGLNIQCWTNVPGDIPQDWDPLGVPNGDFWDYDGSLVDPDGHWELTWDITADEDPFVNANFTLLNTTGSTFTVNIVTTQLVAPPITPDSLMGGSTGGSLTDANFDGVGTAATTNGIPFYNGLIDGVGVLPLHPDPSSWSVPFQGGTENIPAVDDGLPGPFLVGPDVTTSIGIHHVFTITPGDSVGFTSLFVVTPEPGSLALLAVGAVALFRRRRI
jgi:hypothetical protein